MARLYRRSRKQSDKPSRDKISFVLNHDLIELENVDPCLTILQFLRREQQLCGTKQACEEGGCGACTVSVGEMYGSNVHYEAVNSCITFVASLHSKHLVTVEGISQKGKLHPAQQVLLSGHATQCGFCTPGMVMSLYTMSHTQDVKFNKQGIADMLVGNLCRCTGYRSILNAAEKLLKRKSLHRYQYDQRQVITQIKKTPYKFAQKFNHQSVIYHSPTTADELAELIQKYKSATLVAGGTDIGVRHNKMQINLERIISLERVKALRMIRKGKDMFTIGAGATLNEARQVLSPDYPELGELIRRFGSEQIRNKATVVGNLFSDSTAADMPASLIVLDAKLTLRVGHFRRFLKLDDFYQKNGKLSIKSGEFIETMQIPRKLKSSIFQVYKLSKRFDQDTSSICGAFYLRLDTENIVRDIRICYVGMGIIPKRATQVERALIEETWSLQNINQALRFFSKDYSPMDDCRGSQSYKMTAARNLLKRFYLETQSDSIQTRLPVIARG